MNEDINFINPTAIVDNNVRIGHMTYVWHFCHVERGARIGSHCSLGQNVYVGKDVKIGNNCRIQNNVFIPSGVTISDNVFIGPNVTFTNVKHPDARINQHDSYLKTLVCDGASIGAGAVILPGIMLLEDCVVGAGAVVTKDVDFGVTVVGNPARELERV